MLILHLITGLGSGGAENQLREFVTASDKRHFRHVVISLADGGFIAPEVEAGGIEVHSLGMNSGIPSPLAMVRLVRLLRHYHPSVLHCWLYHACLMGVIGARLAGTPRVIWGLRAAHSDLRDFSLTTRTVIGLCARLSGSPYSIVVNSQTARRVHGQLGYKTSKMNVIHNGVDTRRFFPDARARETVRRELGLADNSLLAGMIARFDPMKDHRTFLAAASLIRQKYPAACFLLAGNGIHAGNQELIQLIRENGLRPSICLLEQGCDIPQITAALDVACLSSWAESFPNVVIEAMACAVPCVVTDVGDTRLMVGETGRVVPPRNPNALAKAICEFFAMPAGERAALGQQGRMRVLSQFSLGKTVCAYEAIYQLPLGTVHPSIEVEKAPFQRI